MSNAGVYPQPLTRVTELRVPVLAGLKTARIRCQGTVPHDASDQLALTDVRFVNDGTTQVTVKLVQSDDYTNGPFTDLGSSVTVVPGGQQAASVYPVRRYVELQGLTGTGQVRVTLSSQLRFDEYAFAKTESYYPAAISTPVYTPWSKL